MALSPQQEKQWERLRRVLERVRYGEIRIVINNGAPVRIDSITQQIKLDGSEDDFLQGLSTIEL